MARRWYLYPPVCKTKWNYEFLFRLSANNLIHCTRPGTIWQRWAWDFADMRLCELIFFNKLRLNLITAAVRRCLSGLVSHSVTLAIRLRGIQSVSIFNNIISQILYKTTLLQIYQAVKSHSAILHGTADSTVSPAFLTCHEVNQLGA